MFKTYIPLVISICCVIGLLLELVFLSELSGYNGLYLHEASVIAAIIYVPLHVAIAVIRGFRISFCKRGDEASYELGSKILLIVLGIASVVSVIVALVYALWFFSVFLFYTLAAFSLGRPLDPTIESFFLVALVSAVTPLVFFILELVRRKSKKK